jgi:hypothetical protein
MKKILSILAFLFVCFALTAQDKIISNYGVAGKSFENDIVNNGAIRNAGFATHKLLHNSAKIAAYNYTFQLNVPGPYYFVYSVHMRSYKAGGANTKTVLLKGSLDNVLYTTLDTLTTATSAVADSLTCIAGSNDLLFINDVDRYPLSPLAYKYLRVTVTPITDSIWVKSIWLNVLPVK